MRVYLDSCVLIYLLEGPESSSQAVGRAVQNAITATFCISDLVRLECLVDPLRRNDLERRQAFEAQFRLLTVLPLPPPVFDLAAELRARHNFRTPDALHAAAAVLQGCDEIWTNDRRFEAFGDRIAIRVLPGQEA